MGECEAYGCSSKINKRDPGITFHRFPKDPKLRMMWIRAVCRKDPTTGEIWQPSTNSALCSKHFSEEMFDRTSTAKIRLHKNAVPEIFDGIPKHLQMKRESFIQELDNNDMDHLQSTETELDCIPSDELSQNLLKNSSSSESENEKYHTKSLSFSREESCAPTSEGSTSLDESTKNSRKTFIDVLLNKHNNCAVDYSDEQFQDFLTQANRLESQESDTVKDPGSDSSSEDEVEKSLSNKELKRRIALLEAKLMIKNRENRLLRDRNRRLQQKVEKLSPGTKKAKSQLLYL
ncbi:uncharacterized protein LOC129232551 [Uloborus diversus]|uniref:uncharacterized protein LOC129232551 n=1 Tax=Uloborus diversus TaxID=327109 RepID=UPI00240A4473|nr:uncharacterized protein LOC129232551 [Uloborus diversus]